MPPQSPHILIVLMGSLGDLTRGLCLVAPLRKAYPLARISWLVEPAWRPVLDLVEGIDDIIVFNRPAPVNGVLQLRRELGKRHFDITLDLQRHFKSGFFALLSGAPRRIGFHRRNAKEFNWVFNNEHIDCYSDRLPKIRHYLKFLEPLGIREPEVLDFGFSGLPVPDLLPPSVMGLSAPFAAVVMGSSWITKDWCHDGYRDLARDLLDDRRMPTVLLGDRSKIDEAARVASEVDDERLVNLTGTTTLPELLAILKAAAVAVGPDSGPGHMSAAVGTPYVTLFGPTPVARVVPYNCETFAVASDLDCAPCNKKKCPRRDVLCMRGLSRDLLREKLDRALASPTAS